MDKLTAAKVFVDVAYSGSFSATAEKLEMSRPMVTRYVEAMEGWLQTRLLHRTTRKISLTTLGETCLKDVELWLEQAEELVSITNLSDELSGTIRVAVSMSFGFSQLVPAIKDFMNRHPKVNIDIDLEDSVADLIEQRIDLAIRIASNPDPSLIGKPIGICESVLVASPDYLSKTNAINHPRDLVEHDCLGYKNFERHVWHLFQKDSFESIDIRCKLTANEATTLQHAALHGMGIALQPTYLVSEDLKQGRLQHVLPDWKPISLKIYALYSSRKHLSPAVRSLIDYLEKYYVSHSW
jgi:DNA-binding transcriptional LysR family regulator